MMPTEVEIYLVIGAAWALWLVLTCPDQARSSFPTLWHGVGSMTIVVIAWPVYMGITVCEAIKTVWNK